MRARETGRTLRLLLGVLGSAALLRCGAGMLPPEADGGAMDARAADAGDGRAYDAPGNDGPEGAVSLDAAALADAADARASLDGTGADASSADAPARCSETGPGSTNVWTCAANGRQLERCVAGALETQDCAFGPCLPQPGSLADQCPADPTRSNAASYCAGGNCARWWNCRITYQYQYTSNRDWDTDIHMPDGTPIVLPHRSRLTAVYLVGSGFQPEFTDLVTGAWMHFNHLHLNSEFGGDNRAIGPVQLVSMTDGAHTDHIYPAGWVVGFSGGGTSRTGYAGTDAAGNVCTGGHSTAAHFCAVTTPAHTINYYLPNDGMGCGGQQGWPSALWSMIRPLAPGYASCPSACTGCGVAHF